MTIKRIWTVCVLVLLLCSCIGAVLPVNAEENWSAALKIEKTDENTAEKTITVRVSVEQITCQSGIFLAQYNIWYDNSVLELISWENSRPNGWNFSGSNPDAEDWTETRKTEDGKNDTYLFYTLLNVDTSNGVKRNGVLYTDLHFKVLSDTAESAEILVTDLMFADVALDLCRLPNQKCDIGLQGNSDSSVVPVESEVPDESSEAPSESEPEESVVSDTTTVEGDSADPSSASSEATPPSSDSDTENTSKKVRMWITVEDITDPAGVSSLEFTLKYNTEFLQYVSYECLLPDDWDLRSEYTEDLTQTSNGSIKFWIINHDAGHGAKENGKLGVLVEFRFVGTDFDPSLLTLENILLINDEIKEMSADRYRLATRYEFDGEVMADDAFSSDENEGSVLKILIAVIAAIAVLAAAIVTFFVIRKKKLA